VTDTSHDLGHHPSVPGPGRETTKYEGFLDQALAALSLAQNGVFGLDQLRDLGLSSQAVHTRHATGRLHRIHHKVYSLVPRELLKRDGLYTAAVIACGDGAILSHRSAAALHGLRDWGHTKIEVTVPRRSARRHDGVKVHRSTTLKDKDITVVNNIPCTSVARTLLDLADVVTHRQLERAFDQAEIIQAPLDIVAVLDQIARNPTRAGAKRCRTVLETHYIGKTPTVNENEEALLAITRSLGIPDPETNQFVVLDDGGPAIKADFAWRDRRVIVEADSDKWHNTHQRFESDRVRDQRLIAAGWTVIRTTWRQMKYRPHELRPLLLNLLGPASGAALG
jgi:predicted transcriptional regulator of viral defense system